MHRHAMVRLSVAACAVPLVFAAFALSKKALPEPCRGGFFLAAGAPLVAADATLNSRAIDISGTQISLGGACPPVAGHLKASPKGTVVTAKWAACPGIKGRVRLTARIDKATCNTMTGTIKGKKFKRRFTASRTAPPACGNGILEAGEPCDTATAPTGCAAGRGCIVQGDGCACVVSCEAKHPSTDTFLGAVDNALAEVTDPWVSPDGFLRLFRLVETQLDCSLQDPAASGTPAAVRPLTFPLCEETYDPSVNYCGRNNSCTNPSLANVIVGDCVNRACFAHDRCYDLHCTSPNCAFTQPQADGCDTPLTTACSTCPTMTRIVTMPLVGDTAVPTQDELRRQGICRGADTAIARPASMLPPQCQQPACLGSVCIPDGGGMCASTTSTSTTTTTTTSTTTTSSTSTTEVTTTSTSTTTTTSSSTTTTTTTSTTTTSSTSTPEVTTTSTSTTTTTSSSTTTTTTGTGAECCIATQGCPSETGSSCPGDCCCCPFAQRCCANFAQGCCPAP